ncbi:MAG: hypothetical protein C0434_04580 [Xanthomonadaceae bacterium]|nr:hypothetical protein [Xanthomonadaceae bacterium]
MSRKPPMAASDDDTDLIQSGARWQFGEFELNERRMELRRNGELVKLESKPLNLLMVFLRNPGELITKDDLVNALWPNGIANDGMLSNCVAKLRRELRDDDATLIKTVFRFGYRFDAEPRRIHDEIPAVAPPKLSFNPGDSPPMRPNWRLVRRLGLSGDSWLAEHAKSRARRVFKFSNEPAGLSALKREVTVYRLLRESLGEKVCYVDLLDWNFDEAPWFTEAEYCPAGSLQEWFTAQGGVDKLPLATRLDLIAQIADALAAVHAVGVLHKDLKPANVFVVIDDDGRPTIRLADFGASSLHDSDFLRRLEITRAGFTQMLDTGSSGNAAGTLMYLAPEVAAGQPATVKADIYALGLMLYQFVTGALGRQLSTGWEAEVADEILREDIAAATEGNPERRLADAGELARRLRNIEQRRAALLAERAERERADHAARQLERIKARRVGLQVAFAALAIGFVTSALLYIDARDAREIAELQARRAEAAQRRAEKVADFLGKDMFSAASTDERPVKDLTVKELLDSAARAVPTRFSDELEIATTVQEALGDAYDALAFDREAGNLLEHALELLQRSQAPDSHDALRIATKLVALKYPVGQLPQKIDDYQQLHDHAAVRFGANDPAVFKLGRALAGGRIQLGQFEAGANDLAAMLSLAKSSSNEEIAGQRLSIQGSLGYVLIELGRIDLAEEVINELLQLQIASRGDDHRDVGLSKCRLARIHYESGRLDSAERLLDEASEIAARWDAPHAALPLNIRLYRAWLRYHQQRYREAVAILVAIKADVVEEDASAFDQSYTEDRPLGLAYRALDMRNESEATLSAGYRSALKSLGSRHPWTLQLARDVAADPKPVSERATASLP